MGPTRIQLILHSYACQSAEDERGYKNVNGAAQSMSDCVWS